MEKLSAISRQLSAPKKHDVLADPKWSTWLVYIRPTHGGTAEPIMIDARTYVKPVTGREVLAEFSFLSDYDVILIPDDGIQTARLPDSQTARRDRE